MQYPRIFVSVVLFITLLLSSGCVTHIKTDVTQNPPPTEKFSAFNRFEIKPLTVAAPYAGHGSSEQAARRIQADISVKADPMLNGWNAAGATATHARTLVFTPVIEEVKFVGGNRRFWTGFFSGSSAVILKATITEKETGRVVAEPIFYARAAAAAGAFTIGGMDKVMLVRIAGRLTEYMAANYGSAVGGPTGVER